MPLGFPPLEEFLEKFPHLKERMKAEPRKGVTRESSKRMTQDRNLRATITRDPISTLPISTNSRVTNSSGVVKMEPSKQEEAV
jgi:hypothetical protein